MRVCAALAARPPPSWYFLSLSGQQQAARQPHRQDTAHCAPPSLLPPPVSASPLSLAASPCRWSPVTPCPGPGLDTLARPSTAPPAAASTAPLLVAAHCSLPRCPPGPLLPPAAGGGAGGGEPPVPLPGGRCTLCTVHPRCRDCALCKIRLSCAVLGWPQWPHRRTPARAAVIIPPTPGPHFYTSQHRNISHSALWHYCTAWS